MASQYPHQGEQYYPAESGHLHPGQGQYNTQGGHGTHFNRSSSEGASGSSNNKDKVDDNELETIHTNERVGSHTNYYEKGGLRTEGDGMDHVGAHNKVRTRLPHLDIRSGSN